MSDRKVYLGSLRLTSLMVLILAMLAGCTKNESEVKFGLAADSDGTYSLTYYASDKVKGWLVEDVQAVRQGKAVATVRTVNPTLVWLSTTGSRMHLPAVFYVRRGDDILISGAGSDPFNWKVEGNRISEQISDWRIGVAKTLLKTTDPTARIRLVNTEVEKYVRENPDSPSAALILLCYYDRRINESGFAQAASMLRGDAADLRWRALVGAADVDPVAPLDAPSSKLPGRILLKTPRNGADTVVPGRVPTLLYFTRNNIADYASDIRILRTLCRDFPDSSRRVIADISFEPDSALRGYKLRTDSLRGALRAWMPLGVSDSTARLLRVRRVPYAIVIDTKSEAAYRGDDIVKADSVFRSLLK